MNIINSLSLIAVSGQINSGKNTVTEYLVEHYGYRPESFADSLKDSLSVVFGWPRDLLDGSTKESRDFREIVDLWWSKKLNIPNFTPRYAMQHIGTNLFRDKFNEDIWVYSVERKILDTMRRHNNCRVVISDLRFPNEWSMIKRLNGYTVRVYRGDKPSYWGKDPQYISVHHPELHPSEYSLSTVSDSEFNTILSNNKTVEDLHYNIDQMMYSHSL